MNNRRAQFDACASPPKSPNSCNRMRAGRPLRGLLVAAILAAAAMPAAAQKVETGAVEPNEEHIIGFPGLKPGFKGVLSVQGDSLVMAWVKTKSSIKIADILDVFTSEDTQQVFRGTAGGIIKAGTPYEGGRVLSLFSQAVEELTVEFRDANGGFHGAIFTCMKGKASDLKKKLVAAGAHVTIPPDAPAAQGKEEKKP